ncbi:MAG: molecular chaperone DnaK, partial [Candidatus Omnitrophica bacterium]|nr:molecular chaperone DnaK [Candidatus Omnitrophota bacterium]
EKSLKEFGDKVSQSDRADIESRLNELKQAIKEKNLPSIKRGMEDLTKAAHKLAEEVYKKTAGAGKGPGAQPGGPGVEEPQQGAPEPGQEAPGPKQGEEIIDAEYTAENEDDKKKKK